MQLKIESEQKCFYVIIINDVISDNKNAEHSEECLQNKATDDTNRVTVITGIKMHLFPFNGSYRLFADKSP